METFRVLIDGTWQAAASGETFTTENPFLGTVWAEVPRCAAADVDAAVAAAKRTFDARVWAGMTATARGTVLCRIADLVETHAETLAQCEVRDNGKLYAEMLNQCRYMANWYRYYGGLADKIEGRVPPIDKEGVFNYVRYEPVGVCALITPWNSPLFLLAWKLAPALAAGCSVVIKPSEFTSTSTLKFLELLDDVGLPPGVVNVITGFGAEVGEALVSHPDVRKIAFTGGETTGRRINEIAARGFKRVTLELGGKSPNIIFPDANLEAAVLGVISGVFAATGQTCIAGSRLLVHQDIHDIVVARLIARLEGVRLGDPMDPETEIAPVATRPQRDRILAHIRAGVEQGARLVLGSDNLARGDGDRDNFVSPTIFVDVDNAMAIAQEEIFGPVLCVIPFRDIDEAVVIANAVEYGLAAGVWTSSIETAIAMSDRLQAGTVWVNTYRATSYTTPFGGVKNSGVGRENGRDAIFEYLEEKSVWIAQPKIVANPFLRR